MRWGEPLSLDFVRRMSRRCSSFCVALPSESNQRTLTALALAACSYYLAPGVRQVVDTPLRPSFVLHSTPMPSNRKVSLVASTYLCLMHSEMHAMDACYLEQPQKENGRSVQACRCDVSQHSHRGVLRGFERAPAPILRPCARAAEEFSEENRVRYGNARSSPKGSPTTPKPLYDLSTRTLFGVQIAGRGRVNMGMGLFS